MLVGAGSRTSEINAIIARVVLLLALALAPAPLASNDISARAAHQVMSIVTSEYVAPLAYDQDCPGHHSHIGQDQCCIGTAACALFALLPDSYKDSPSSKPSIGWVNSRIAASAAQALPERPPKHS